VKAEFNPPSRKGQVLWTEQHNAIGRLRAMGALKSHLKSLHSEGRDSIQSPGARGEWDRETGGAQSMDAWDAREEKDRNAKENCTTLILEMCVESGEGRLKAKTKALSCKLTSGG